MRFLFYSHDGLGLGHTRRHLAVATELAKKAPQAAILLATGSEDVVRHGLPRQIEVLKLPGLRKESNQKYGPRRLRVSMDEIRNIRSALLLTTVKTFQPAVVLVDKHPFGASGELKSALKALARIGGRPVLGLRDILDESRQVLAEWQPYKMQRRIAESYNQVLVYGDRAVFDPIKEYEFPPDLEARTRFCGYVSSSTHERCLENFEWPFPNRNDRIRPVVLATAGGGEDGFRTLETFIRAASGAEWQGVAVAGPMIPDGELAALEKLAHEHRVVFRTFVPHLPALFHSLDALVTMGGYNTLVEAVSAGVRTICVPRVSPRAEQLMRAEAFERLGLLRMCHPAGLTPALLGKAISNALSESSDGLRKKAHATLRFDGAARAAAHLIELAQQGLKKNGSNGAAHRRQTAPRV
jgi:predicted glycosyltransferase